VGVQVFGSFFIVHGFLDCSNLLSVGKFDSWGAWDTGLSGLGRSWGTRFGWCRGFVGTNGSVGVFQTVTSHVALKVAPKAPAFLGKLGTLLWGKLLKLCGISSIDIHGDVIQIRLLLAWLTQLVLETPEVTWLLLVVLLCSSESCVILLLGLSNFISSGCFPFIHGAWYFVSI
jgi:hypothetical protein